jgi:3-hydroxy-3-methylglutaryl-CoA-synthase
MTGCKAAAENGSSGERPQNVGILATEVYFPSTHVSQAELEAANGVSAGKYTIGLGQLNMAFTGDREDINSICLTAVAHLLEKYSIDGNDVGRLEVGTETLIDKSKSTKTVLMPLLGEENTDVEGVTSVNACYGGTAALLNAIAWVESSAWDGRYAVVVAADIAVYAEGPARPTGGCGAVAVLVGPNAPLAINPHCRTTHASHVWDFYKSDFHSEYPKVDGALSQSCYLRAIDDCYTRFCDKKDRTAAAAAAELYTADSADYFVFHSPYNKLVQKSFARLYYCDARRCAAARRPLPAHLQCLEQWAAAPLESTYTDRKLEAALKDVAAAAYKARVAPSCTLSQAVGNTYTASVFLNIAGLVDAVGPALEGKRVVVFSYGSGALATMYELIGRQPQQQQQQQSSQQQQQQQQQPFTLQRIAATVNLHERLQDRELLPPAELTSALAARAEAHGVAPYTPTYPLNRLFPGTFYLAEVRQDGTRHYERVTAATVTRVKRGGLAAAAVADSEADADTASTTSSTELSAGSSHSSSSSSAPAAAAAKTIAADSEAAPVASVHATTTAAKGLLNGTAAVTAVAAAPQQQLLLQRVVVAGVACGLPGQANVFEADNLQRLLSGKSCFAPLSASNKAALLEKNVVQLRKGSTPGAPPVRLPITDASQTIQIAARLGHMDLGAYGVSASIAATMDKAVQVAVAAGLEALRDAGIVKGGPRAEDWALPEHMRDTTGVVYATSFPALDAAIGEVMRFLRSRCVTRAKKGRLVAALRDRLRQRSASGSIAAEDEESLRGLEKAVMTKSAMNLAGLGAEAEQRAAAAAAAAAAAQEADEEDDVAYEFDRKFLFRVLVLGNAQLAQITGARGPNMQTNAACAGSTQAVAMAQDMMAVGRAERMIVIAGDDASGDALLPWLGNGFRALGAASIATTAESAALPFSAARNGMLLGSGAIGMVLETEGAAATRSSSSANSSGSSSSGGSKARLLETQISNSAYHGASMDREHIAVELERFLVTVEARHGVTRQDIATKGVYFSHETCTHATPTASCAYNEVWGLRRCFGALLDSLVIINTKGFTGHAMGVSFEDVAAVEVLRTGMLPPTANTVDVDPALGPLRLSRGGPYPAQYALRFAAGFGSQVAFALYATTTAQQQQQSA